MGSWYSRRIGKKVYFCLFLLLATIQYDHEIISLIILARYEPKLKRAKKNFEPRKS